jgi:hypothetical protein
MGTGTKIGLGLLIAFVVATIFGVGSVVSTNNECVTQEAGITAQYKQNQNNYDNYIKKVQEVAQIPAMYVDGLKKIYTAALTGRYGANGSKAVFQFIKEQNPNVDPAVYTKIQPIIEAGRTSFEADQKMLLDKKRVYEVELKSFPNNLIASTLGFPKLDLSKYDIVTSDETEKAFESKKSAPLKIGAGQ